jgi:hypothetical protein
MKMRRVTIIKNFPFTLDGKTFEQAFADPEALVPLPDAWVADLAKKGYVSADPLDHDGNGKKGGSNPSDDDIVYTAAQLIAAVAADPPMDWNTFKAAATKLLGPDAPTKKVELVAALEERAKADAAVV